MFLRNVGIYLQVYTALLPRSPTSIFYILTCFCKVCINLILCLSKFTVMISRCVSKYAKTIGLYNKICRCKILLPRSSNFDPILQLSGHSDLQTKI
jgi:hypothetical protein